MTTRFLIAASLLALAACGSKSDGNSTKASGGGLFGGGPVTLQAGEWEMSREVVSVNAPNMPPEMLARMKQPKATSRSCMTEEEAKGPKAESFGALTNSGCKTDGFVWSGGRIHSKVTCEGVKGAGKLAMEMDGSYTPVSIDITAKTATEAGGVQMNQEMRITGRRIGECPAGQAGKAG
jgi:hypothetical protein